MGVKCAGYRVLDWFRRSWVGRKTFYYGVEIEIRPNVTVTGVITSDPKGESDGDVTFDLWIDAPDLRGPYRHCEVTPCDGDAIKAVAKTLKIGDRITATADERFDPKHILGGSNPGWWELHGNWQALAILGRQKEAA